MQGLLLRKIRKMETDSIFDNDLYNLFSAMIDDDVEKKILELIIHNRGNESIIDELIKELEWGKDDKN